MNAKHWQEHLSDALNTNDPETMQKALAQVPKEHLQMTIQAIKDQGHGLYREGRYEEACDAYTQVMSLGTKDYFVLYHQADCLFQLERFDEAYQAAVSTIELHPEYHKLHRLLGQICLQRKDQAGALEALSQALTLDKGDKKLAEQVAVLTREVKEKEDVLNRVFNPESAEQEAPELPPLPELSFDPAVIHAPEPTDINENMRKGLNTFLKNFAELEGPRELIARMEDPAWVNAWCDLLADQKDKRVVVWGPEAGLLPLHAIDGGATSVVSWDPCPLTRRLAEGTIQKTLVARLVKQHGAAWTDMSKEERSEIFEKLAAPFNLLQKAPDALEEDIPPQSEVVVITQFDHTLLGRGFSAALKAIKSKLVGKKMTLLPAKARIFASAIQWDYRCDGNNLAALDTYHWSPYPLQVTPESGSWRSLTEPTLVAELDLGRLKSKCTNLSLPVVEAGTVHGVLFWYELDLGGKTLNTGPQGNCSWPGQAYQYLDNRAVALGENLALKLDINPERILFQGEEPNRIARDGCLPLWHIHGANDTAFQKTYLDAVAAAVKASGAKTVLNIGAGNGLVAMAAARAGAQVYACEQSELLCANLQVILKDNGLSDQVTLLNEDCRKLTIPEHLPYKVDMVVFDKFDCGLLGDGIIHYLEYALPNLAVEDAEVFPKSGRIKSMLIERRLQECRGYDVALLTPYLFSPEYTHVHLNRVPYRALSEPMDAFSFNFATAKVAEEEVSFEITILEDGIAGAMVFWYELDLDENTTLSTSPLLPQPERGQALQYLPEIRMEAGEKLGMKAKHTGSNIMFGVNPEGIDEERILQLPRFDSNWLNAQRKLMEQSGQIMQQLRSNPEEYARAFQLAQHFAVHPQRYDLSPSMAARYLFTFLSR